MKNKTTIFVIVLLGLFSIKGSDPRAINRMTFEQNYSFINYEINKLDAEKPANLNKFFTKLDKMVSQNEGKVRIVQIGDSHIQADYFSGRLRELLQMTFGNGGRGFVYPYRMARTNNPPNYHVDYGGYWQSCRSVQNNASCDFGVSGITSVTSSVESYFNLDFSNDGFLNYDFSKVRLFYKQIPSSFTVNFDNPDEEGFYFDEQPGHGYSDFFFSKPQTKLQMKLKQDDSSQNFFQLYGMELENKQPGIIYNAIGTNGADCKSYHRCEMFTQQLEALRPDLVIISLGTNDGYVPTSWFNVEEFKKQYVDLIKKARIASPNASILLTTPGDSYRKRKYHNYNMVTIQQALYEIGEEYGCVVWDLFDVMGGRYSIKKWYYNGLAQRDLVHYTKRGYETQAELLYDAIMSAYEKRLD